MYTAVCYAGGCFTSNKKLVKITLKSKKIDNKLIITEKYGKILLRKGTDVSVRLIKQFYFYVRCTEKRPGHGRTKKNIKVFEKTF